MGHSVASATNPAYFVETKSDNSETLMQEVCCPKTTEAQVEVCAHGCANVPKRHAVGVRKLLVLFADRECCPQKAVGNGLR